MRRLRCNNLTRLAIGKSPLLPGNLQITFDSNLCGVRFSARARRNNHHCVVGTRDFRHSHPCQTHGRQNCSVWQQVDASDRDDSALLPDRG